MAWTYAATRKGYAKMWDSLALKGGADEKNAAFFAKKIIKAEAQYKEVEAETDVPWFFIGALHMRESGCDFAGVLHNGDKIIGTRRKTYRVPKGRGPFKTWSASAIDALDMKGLRKWKGQWCPALFGFVSEIFNGLGYVGKGVNSAYVWAGSNHEQRGKYVADHVWDKNFDDPQIGTLTVIKALAAMRPDIADWLAKNHKSPMSTQNKVILTGGGVAGTGAVVNEAANQSSDTMSMFQPFIEMVHMHGTKIALIFTVAVVVGAVGWHFYQKWEARSAETSV